DSRHPQIVNHPALVPAGLVVDYEKARDIREKINGGSNIVGTRGQACLWLQDDAHRADSWQLAVRPSRSRFGSIVNAWDYRSEHVWFETGSIEQIVLEKLTWFCRFAESRDWRKCVRPPGEFC